MIPLTGGEEEMHLACVGMAQAVFGWCIFVKTGADIMENFFNEIYFTTNEKINMSPGNYLFE